MSNSKLDSSVLEFKAFVNNNKKLLIEIRRSGNSWQSYYEKWIILGEDDSYWEQYTDKNNESNHTETEFVEKIAKLAEHIDLNKIENRINQFSNTINMIQELISEFVTHKKLTPEDDNTAQSFHIFRD